MPGRHHADNLLRSTGVPDLISTSAAASTIYVNNQIGSDESDGLAATVTGQSGPVASIERAFALVETSGRVEIANTGVPYQRSYPGDRGRSLVPRAGGTPEHLLVANGNGAVMSGLETEGSKR